MDAQERTFDYTVFSYQSGSEEDMADVRKGPWTLEEDSLLADYITVHGEGRWSTVARYAGLKRTGKSCRLRWLNYLRPNVRRGNITLQEQLLILELHFQWGNRWSKIAQYLPGRTDNEIKNYWRTRVQKLAKQLKCDVNSNQFRDAMRYIWIPRLTERIRASSESSTDQTATMNCSDSSRDQINIHNNNEYGSDWTDPNFLPELSGASSDSVDTTQVSSVSEPPADCPNPPAAYSDCMQHGSGLYTDYDTGYWMQAMEKQEEENGFLCGGDSMEDLWSGENVWFFQQHLM